MITSVRRTIQSASLSTDSIDSLCGRRAEPVEINAEKKVRKPHQDPDFDVSFLGERGVRQKCGPDAGFPGAVELIR